jgi:hypothetical protein
LLHWYRAVWFVVDAADVAVGELADAIRAGGMNGCAGSWASAIEVVDCSGRQADQADQAWRTSAASAPSKYRAPP